MIKRIILTLGLVAGCDAFAAPEFDSRPIRQRIAAEIEAGNVGGLALETYSNMFAEADRQLRKAGKARLADELANDWRQFGQDLLLSFADVGDHEPFNKFIAEWYAKLEAALGVRIMELTHLRDVWVLNYTLKVVFNPEASAAWCLEWDADDCKNEYRRHMAGTRWYRHPDPQADKILHHGFAGVVTYWAVTISCMVGAPGLPVCGLAGTGAEFVMERYLAPGLSNRLYDRVNAEGIVDCIDCCECGCCDGEPCDCENCDCCCDGECPGEDEA
jgi:hypothetical protein